MIERKTSSDISRYTSLGAVATHNVLPADCSLKALHSSVSEDLAAAPFDLAHSLTIGSTNRDDHEEDELLAFEQVLFFR